MLLDTGVFAHKRFYKQAPLHSRKGKRERERDVFVRVRKRDAEGFGAEAEVKFPKVAAIEGSGTDDDE